MTTTTMMMTSKTCCNYNTKTLWLSEKEVWRRRRRRSQWGVVFDPHVASDGRDAVETGEIRQPGVVIDRQVAFDGRDAVETSESRQLGVVPDPQDASDGRDAVETSESRQLGVINQWLKWRGKYNVRGRGVIKKQRGGSCICKTKITESAGIP